MLDWDILGPLHTGWEAWCWVPHPSGLRYLKYQMRPHCPPYGMNAIVWLHRSLYKGRCSLVSLQFIADALTAVRASGQGLVTHCCFLQPWAQTLGAAPIVSRTFSASPLLHLLS